ncbi:hypothetical protein EYF80_051011 [Liparis tanakae]|uniref:Uncharacterized protein n=1 Tax=Liparis tanakae TaxID=230148 RepID=A0A4Z2FCB9_9TELE|nr:hypothetical protein EYF80_051011 [Liparis tanakae]
MLRRVQRWPCKQTPPRRSGKHIRGRASPRDRPRRLYFPLLFVLRSATSAKTLSAVRAPGLVGRHVLRDHQQQLTVLPSQLLA